MADQSTFWWGLPVDVWDAWGLKLMIVGAALGLIALVASLASSFILYKTGNVFQSQVAETHARLNVETGRLNVEIGRLNKEAAEANAGAILAQARALEAQLELAKFKTPRRLTSEQKAALAERLKAFSGTNFAMSIAPGDAADLAIDIGEALKSAGWNWISWPVRWSQVVKTKGGRPEMGIDLMRGIATHISDEALAPLATELFVGLTEAGYANKWVVVPAPREGLYHFIGTKDLLTVEELRAIVDKRDIDLEVDKTIDLLIWYGFIGIVSGHKPVFIYDRAYDFRRLEAERPTDPKETLYAVNPAFLVGLRKD